MEKIIVDAIGDQCPIPVVKAKQAIDSLTSPAELEVRVDNDTAVQNLLRMASGLSCAAKSETLPDGNYAVTITADETALAAREKNADVNPVFYCSPESLHQGHGTVVAVGSCCMGNGDENLGKILIKGFLYALAHQDEAPEAVLFYNSGAFLTTQGTESEEDLKLLEERGTKILTCGTCLDYYGLKEKLLVGGVTNMYDIVSMLSSAAKVIRP